MAQERFWNWQDDDSTFRLNWRELGILEPGRYRGFDADLAYAALQLRLHHGTTGIVKTKLNLTASAIMGVWLSKQGCVVSEDTDLILPITAGGAQPRIDLIVATHEYIQVVGGSPATYSVVSGTPAVTPVAPALPFPTKQVVLGQLYVPAGMTTLSGPGVVYTQINTPTLANVPLGNLAYTDVNNIFVPAQTFLSGFGTFTGNIIDVNGYLTINGTGQFARITTMNANFLKGIDERVTSYNIGKVFYLQFDSGIGGNIAYPISHNVAGMPVGVNQIYLGDKQTTNKKEIFVRPNGVVGIKKISSTQWMVFSVYGEVSEEFRVVGNAGQPNFLATPGGISFAGVTHIDFKKDIASNIHVRINTYIINVSGSQSWNWVLLPPEYIPNQTVYAKARTFGGSAPNIYASVDVSGYVGLSIDANTVGTAFEVYLVVNAKW